MTETVGAARQELTDTERAVLDAVRDLARRGELVRDLGALLRIPSVTGSDAEADAQQWVAHRLERLGLDVDHWRMDLDDLAGRAGYPGTEAPRTEAWGVVGTSHDDRDGDTGAPAIVLQGHVDVVPPGDPASWDGDPFTPRIVGLGNRDVMVRPRRLRHEGRRRGGARGARGAAAAPASGRGGGSRATASSARRTAGSARSARSRRGHRGEACVIPEPTDRPRRHGERRRADVPPRGRPARPRTAARGRRASALSRRSCPCTPRCSSSSGAAARDPDPLMAGYRLAYPLSIGTVRAGDWASTVPDLLVAEGRYGVALGRGPRRRPRRVRGGRRRRLRGTTPGSASTRCG